MSGPLDGLNKLPLMLGTGPGDSFGNDPALFGDKALQSLLVLVIDVVFFVFTESAGSFLPNLLCSLKHTSPLGTSTSLCACHFSHG